MSEKSIQKDNHVNEEYLLDHLGSFTTALLHRHPGTPSGPVCVISMIKWQGFLGCFTNICKYDCGCLKVSPEENPC